ncbi:MarR family winged helix-turn-helix transcriptional regulator [Burkholderia anthina]|uniref:MarR family winged helix-turn-helix transcriptional regulator n=1 Tax=Burkholderia anthina TaxID=179879 RepID=UPI00158C60A3|nr:MarR family transcriptional regulator [Burkholderia anthina]
MNRVADFCLEESLVYVIVRARAEMHNLATRHLMSRYGVTAQQGSILFAIASDRCLAASDIARVFGMDASAATRMVDRLEKRGLLNRVRNDPDRRVFRLVLTEKGQLIAASVPSVLDSVTEMSFIDCSREEIATLKVMLRRILSNLDDP